MAIEDKVKLVVVRRDSPDVETVLGTFPTKDAALPAFRELIGKADTLRVTTSQSMVTEPRTISRRIKADVGVTNGK
jgi:hypothetical protein